MAKPLTSRDWLFLLAVAIISGLLWLPVMMLPSVDLENIPFGAIALAAAVSAYISGKHYVSIALAATFGQMAGLVTGVVVWGVRDILAGPLIPLAVALTGAITFAATSLSCLCVAFLIHRFGNPRRLLAVVALCLLAIVSVGLIASEPYIVRRRLAYNDALAGRRARALFLAAKACLNSHEDCCNGENIKAHYQGPPFRDPQWARIAGVYVKEQGYFFVVHCEKVSSPGVLVEADPATPGETGTRSINIDTRGDLVSVNSRFPH